MTAHFDEFEEEMTSRSLERAYDYVDEHIRLCRRLRRASAYGVLVAL